MLFDFQKFMKKSRCFFKVKERNRERERISKISEIGEYKESRPLAVYSLLSLHTYLIPYIYIYIYAISALLYYQFSISLLCLLVYLLIRLTTILALLNLYSSISFISSFTISFNLYILYPLYHQIRIIHIPISLTYFHHYCLCITYYPTTRSYFYYCTK